MENKIQVVTGHHSPETAYVVDDYPYGRQLRCKIRYWIETDEKKGQRFCSQTTDARNGNVRWNNPKKSVYSEVMVMYIEPGTGYLKHDACQVTYSEQKTREFLEKYKEGLVLDYHKRKIAYANKIFLVRQHMDKLTGGENIFSFEVSKRKEIQAQAYRNAAAEMGLSVKDFIEMQ